MENNNGNREQHDSTDKRNDNVNRNDRREYNNANRNDRGDNNVKNNSRNDNNSYNKNDRRDNGKYNKNYNKNNRKENNRYNKNDRKDHRRYDKRNDNNYKNRNENNEQEKDIDMLENKGKVNVNNENIKNNFENLEKSVDVKKNSDTNENTSINENIDKLDNSTTNKVNDEKNYVDSDKVDIVEKEDKISVIENENSERNENTTKKEDVENKIYKQENMNSGEVKEDIKVVQEENKQLDRQDNTIGNEVVDNKNESISDNDIDKQVSKKEDATKENDKNESIQENIDEEIKSEDASQSDKLITVIGVRFRAAGKIYYFDPLELVISVGDNVIVETARGIEYGQVVIANKEIKESEIIQPLKSVIRVATPEDDEVEKKNKEKEKEAFGICLEKIRKHGLEMKLIDSEYTFDNNKVLFYFTADGRIDFRELVKDLAAIFKTRIELRQIGVRDETKILGGIGSCGRMLCCNTYLPEFAPVSIKMAKEQNLSLNPTKISGVCGRLMCCLKNEQDLYEEANSKMPEVGEPVTTNDGLKGEVHSISVLKQMVRVVVTLENDEKEARDYHVDDLKFKMRKRNDKVQMDDELKKLEMLERKEGKSLLDDE